MKLATATCPASGHPWLHVFGGGIAKLFETRLVTQSFGKQTVFGSLSQRGVTACNPMLRHPVLNARQGGPRGSGRLANSAFNLWGRPGQNVPVDGDEAREAAAIDCTLHRKRQRRRVRIARPPQGLDFNKLLVARPSCFRGEWFMTLLAVKHQVQLLSNAKGVYGIGLVRGAVEDFLGQPPEVVLRPDRLLEAKTCAAALQMIFGGFRHGMFSHMTDERLRREIHREMLRRRGLDWPPVRQKWWSEDSEQQARNRQIYHGLRLNSLAVINGLIGEALEAAAEPNALALARRFRFRQRYEIYRGAAASPRPLQLSDVFPALGLAIFDVRSRHGKVSLAQEAKRLVEGGARLRKIAELMGVPTALRRVKPGAAHLALAVADAFEDPRLIDAHMPESLTDMKLWLRCIGLAHSVGPDFVQWTARHATEVGSSPGEVIGILRDLADWVRACYRASVPAHIRRALLGDHPFLGAQGEQFIHREFNADMSLVTVTKLSADWHEAVAANMTGPNSEFPEPWCPGGRIWRLRHRPNHKKCRPLPRGQTAASLRRYLRGEGALGPVLCLLSYFASRSQPVETRR